MKRQKRKKEKKKGIRPKKVREMRIGKDEVHVCIYGCYSSLWVNLSESIIKLKQTIKEF